MKRDYRQDFPLLRENPIVYLDSAATAQRPDAVIEAEMEFYRKYNANPLRGLYSLGIEATDRYEEARECVAKFIHAASAKEIIFTRNATESLNLVAYSYGLSHLRKGDEIVVSILEHHSNQLPWRMVAEKQVRSSSIWNVTGRDIFWMRICRPLSRKNKAGRSYPGIQCAWYQDTNRQDRRTGKEKRSCSCAGCSAVYAAYGS